MKRVAVIGAGAAGLSALKSLSSHFDKLSFVAFEQSDRVGGTWIHNDKYKPTSMYDNLLTNLPKEIMAFPGFPFPTNVKESFVNHRVVLSYLESFAEHFNLKPFIKFRTTVTLVDVEDPFADRGRETWCVTTRNSNGDETMEKFDAVFVCNGHYTVPLMPDIAGLSTFSGEVLHSHYYRNPSAFSGKRVVVLGAGPSGTDIALDCVNHASKVYLSHNKSPVGAGDQLTQVAGIESVDGSKILLKDGSAITADCIILATGYRFSFPFLADRCQPLIENERVKSTYRMLVDSVHPTMYFVGLCKGVVPFPQFFAQTEFCVSAFLGNIAIPSTDAIEEDNAALYKEYVTDRGAKEHHFHFMREKQWAYNNQLVKDIGGTPLDSNVEKLYEYTTKERHANLPTYKKARFRLRGSDDFIKVDVDERPLLCD